MEVFLSSASGDTFNRLQVSANTGSTPFDIGRVDLTQAVGDTENLGDSVFIHDDGPAVTVDDTSGTFALGAQGDWDHNPGTDTFKSLSLTLNSYTIGDGSAVIVDTSSRNGTGTDANGNYVFPGSITADFTDDGVANPQTIEFTLTFDPDNPETYDLQVDTPPDTVILRDTSQGQLKAGGPDPVQTLLFGTPPTDAGLDDVVFFGAVANATKSGVPGGDALATPPEPPNDLLDLIYPETTDLTEEQIEAFLFPTEAKIPTLINSATKMNVSTSGIGINNNNLDGSGTEVQAGDESFVFNPEEDADRVIVYIDNAVGGYSPPTEELYYTVYYTDGTVSAQTLVTAGMLEDALRTDPTVPQAARGGKLFEIDGGDKEIDAVQLTMGAGTVKNPGDPVGDREEFNPEDLS